LKLYNKLDHLHDFGCMGTYAYIGQRGDTILDHAVLKFFKNKKDSMVGYSFILAKENGDKVIYDGIYCLDLVHDSKVYRLTNVQENARLLESSWCTPMTIKRLLKLCLTPDAVEYTLSEKDGDYQLKIVLPYFGFDGYISKKISKTNKQKTEYTILFDRNTLLPKYELLDIVGMTQNCASFNGYQTIKPQIVVARDSVPSDFHLIDKINMEKSSINKQAPNFKLKQLNGDSIELYKIENKYTLLEFSGPACGACKLSTPFLIKSKALMESKNIDLYVIDDVAHSNLEELSKYIAEQKINYPYLIDGGEVGAKYKIMCLPTYFLIDKAKKIVEMKMGYNENVLKEMIERIN